MAFFTDRDAARLAGQLHFHGEVCGLGHNGVRYVSNRSCVECVAKNVLTLRGKQSALKNDQSNFSHPVMVFGNPERVRGISQ